LLFFKQRIQLLIIYDNIFLKSNIYYQKKSKRYNNRLLDETSSAEINRIFAQNPIFYVL